MHLAGETHAADLLRRNAGGFDDITDSLLGCTPPVGGILFGPRGPRRGKRLMSGRAGSEDCSVFRYENRARSAGPYVYAKDRNSFVSVSVISRFPNLI
jgi:hypothetical protein